jgi:hypothetical protein
MREIESGKGMAEVARMFQVSPKRLETSSEGCFSVIFENVQY